MIKIAKWEKQTNKSLITSPLLVLFFLTLTLITTATEASYLHAKGSKLYNDKEEAVRLTGVNWFGFETQNMSPHGLWARDYHGVLNQIKDMGFNSIRMPFCNAMLRDGAKTSSILDYGIDSCYKREMADMNKEIIGLSPLKMMDEIIRYAGELGLVIILDNHSREPDGYMNELVWYTEETSEKQWIDDWVMLAKRYKDNPTVVGFDLENEPHGKSGQANASTWGSGNSSTDWNTAAQKCGNAILEVNPNVLIIIEGVESYKSTGYWWGGNLRGVRSTPIVLSKPDKLVYSPHEYGPEVFQQLWFSDSNFPSNLEGIWNDAFGYIVKDNIAPLLVGEFGISDSSSFQGKAGIWFTKLLKFMTDNFYSWTFWAFNPNSGDTGGILKYDWYTPEWKLGVIKPYLAPLINSPSPVITRKSRPMQQSKFLSVSNNYIKCQGVSTEQYKLEIRNLTGQLISSSTSFPVSLKQVPASGTYIAVLYKSGMIVDQIRFSSR